MEIQAGVYQCKAVPGSARCGLSSNDNEQIAIDLKVKLNDGTYTQLTTVLTITDNSEELVKRRLRSLGWDGSIDAGFTGLGSQVASCEVSYSMYEGKQKMNVDIVPSFTFKNQLSEQGKRGLMARLSGGGSSGGNRGWQQQPPTQQRQQQREQQQGYYNPPPDQFSGDDDIPF